MNQAAKPRIALVGAYDRFNYGDLLFPILARDELAARGLSHDMTAYALSRSDLSEFGAMPTLGMRSLYGGRALQDGDVVVFNGGGTIGADWVNMQANLVGPRGNYLLYALQRAVGQQRAVNLVRRFRGARSPFPWVAGPQDFPHRVKIAYNAVGGSELAVQPADIQQQTLARLAQADFVSVRDHETQRLLLGGGVAEVALAPDSAVLMSKHFPLARLAGLVGTRTQQRLRGEPFVVAQCNARYAQRHRDDLAALLADIHRRHGLRAILLPIGRYTGLDDIQGLTDIQARAGSPVEVVDEEASIWDIMATIAHASLFLGTSLHGNITSQAFGVPHLGLSDKPHKLDYYLHTWDTESQRACVRPADAIGAIGQALSAPAAERAALVNRLHRASEVNYSQLMDACGLVPRPGTSTSPAVALSTVPADAARAEWSA